MRKTNLYELLGRPVPDAAPDSGTYMTATPETFDDDSQMPSITDYGTIITKAGMETFDDDSQMPSITDCGTVHTRSSLETYDDDSHLPLM